MEDILRLKKKWRNKLHSIARCHFFNNLMTNNHQDACNIHGIG